MTPVRPAAPAPGPIAELPGEVNPKLFYLPDKDGNLQAVPGFTFESFVEAYKLKHRLDQKEQKPRFTVKQLDFDGTAGTDHAELTVKMTIALGDTQWVRVPLRLGAAVLREQPQCEGPADYLVHFEDDREGYVCWLRGDPEKTHILTLKILAPLVARRRRDATEALGPPRDDVAGQTRCACRSRLGAPHRRRRIG